MGPTTGCETKTPLRGVQAKKDLDARSERAIAELREWGRTRLAFIEQTAPAGGLVTVSRDGHQIDARVKDGKFTWGYEPAHEAYLLKLIVDGINEGGVGVIVRSQLGAKDPFTGCPIAEIRGYHLALDTIVQQTADDVAEATAIGPDGPLPKEKSVCHAGPDEPLVLNVAEPPGRLVALPERALTICDAMDMDSDSEDFVDGLRTTMVLVEYGFPDRQIDMKDIWLEDPESPKAVKRYERETQAAFKDLTGEGGKDFVVFNVGRLTPLRRCECCEEFSVTRVGSIDFLVRTARNMTMTRVDHFAGHKSTVGRNDPCPCGSGKKWKKCCAGREVE